MTTDFGREWPPQPGRSPSASGCEVHRETIELGLSRGRNAVAIFQDLVDVHGFSGGYQSVKRFVRKLRGKQSPGACVLIETAPGEEARSITAAALLCATRRLASIPVKTQFRLNGELCHGIVTTNVHA